MLVLDRFRCGGAVSPLFFDAFSNKNYFLLHKDFIHANYDINSPQVPQGQVNEEEIPLDIEARYKNVNFHYVYAVGITCYASWRIVFVLIATAIEYNFALIATVTLVYLNSSLNQILYCWTIRESKQVVKDTIRQLNCFLNSY